MLFTCSGEVSRHVRTGGPSFCALIIPISGIRSRILAASTARPEEYENGLGQRYARRVAVFTWPRPAVRLFVLAYFLRLCTRPQDPGLLIAEPRKTQSRIDRTLVAFVRARYQYEHRGRNSGVSSRASPFSVLSSGLTKICIAGRLIIPQMCISDGPQ